MDRIVLEQLKILKEKAERKEISRRDFLRMAALLGAGVSMAGATGALAQCPLSETATVTPLPCHLDPKCDIEFPLEMSTNTPFAKREPKFPSPTPTRGLDPSFYYPTPSGAPTMAPRKNASNSWYCLACGKVFKNMDDFQRHAQEHAVHFPQLQELDHPLYDEWIEGDVPRFDQCNHAIARSRWDEPYQKRMKEYGALASEHNDLEETALYAGGGFMDGLIKGSIVWDDGGLYWPTSKVGGDPVREGGEDTIKGQFKVDRSKTYPAKDIAEMTAKVKRAARIYGADLVGVCELDERWVYTTVFKGQKSDAPQSMPFPYVIVIAVHMRDDLVADSPGMLANAASVFGYSEMAFVAVSLAKYITALGYGAQPSFNETAQNIPLAMKAGLGEQGRNGLLQTPEFGSAVRLAKVFTDLPLLPDKPIEFGLQDYCAQCHSCAISCPVRAIDMEGDRTLDTYSISNRTGIRKWVVNTETCFLYWQENGKSCMNCISACPWTLSRGRIWLNY